MKWPEHSKDSIAIVTAGEELSYGRLVQRIGQVATCMLEQGIRKDEIVAIYGSNSLEFVYAFFALLRIGATVLPLSNSLPPCATDRILNGMGCRKLFQADSGSDFDDIGAEVCTFSDYDKSQAPPIVTEVLTGKTLIMTSGSSGEPKGVLHNLSSHVVSAIASNEKILFGANDRWMLSLPLNHIGGIAILFRTFMSGGTMVIPEKKVPIVQSIERFGVTHISLVETQLARLLSDSRSGAKISSLKAVLVGGGPVSRSLLKEATARYLPIYLTYGLTEAASQVTTTGDTKQLSTSGKPLSHMSVAITEAGVIRIRGESLFSGYLINGEIHFATDSDGWFETSDIGSIDKDGCLTVIGRIDNMFVSGGENIHPEEIERSLVEHEDIKRAVVVDIADSEYGRRPVAFVQLSTHDNIDEDALRQWLLQRISRFKVPDRFYSLSELTDGDQLKWSRKELRTRAEAISKEIS